MLWTESDFYWVLGTLAGTNKRVGKELMKVNRGNRKWGVEVNKHVHFTLVPSRERTTEEHSRMWDNTEKAPLELMRRTGQSKKNKDKHHTC